MPAGKIFRQFTSKKRLTLKKVNRKINILKNKVEIKEFYKTIAEAALDGNKAIVMNTMVQGDDNEERTGNKVFMVKFRSIIRLKLINSELDGTETSTAWTLTATDSTLVRVIAFVNKINNAEAVFSLPEILRTGVSSVTNQTSMHNVDYVQDSKMKNKYRILYDRSFNFVPNTPSSDRIIKINKSLRMNTLYNATNGGTGADIINNKVEILILPHKTGTMNYAFNSVLSYSDS